MEKLQPGERKAVRENGHLIYLDERWESLMKSLERDKDRIMAELEADQEAEQATGNSN